METGKMLQGTVRLGTNYTRLLEITAIAAPLQINTSTPMLPTASLQITGATFEASLCHMEWTSHTK